MREVWVSYRPSSRAILTGLTSLNSRTDCSFDITVTSWNPYWLDPPTFINVRLRDCVGLFVSFRVDPLSRVRSFDMCDSSQTTQPITGISGTEFLHREPNRLGLGHTRSTLRATRSSLWFGWTSSVTNCSSTPPRDDGNRPTHAIHV